MKLESMGRKNFGETICASPKHTLLVYRISVDFTYDFVSLRTHVQKASFYHVKSHFLKGKKSCMGS